MSLIWKGKGTEASSPRETTPYEEISTGASQGHQGND